MKIIKIVWGKYAEFDLGWGPTPDPDGELSAPQTPSWI